MLALTCLGAPPDAADGGELPHADLLWLQRITYGVDSSTLERFRRLGKAGFLSEQLAGTNERLPEFVQKSIDAMDISHVSMPKVMADLAARRREAKSAGNDAKLEARKEYVKQGVAEVRQVDERELLRAVYSPAQLKEQMNWFWLNHFNVFARKGPEPWLLADYGEHAIRPHALGRFRDLVMATLTHPAMLIYLDNARNARDRINENYARELMELHTLGVDSGYTQKDVQELARILTGVSIALPEAQRRAQRVQSLQIGDGAFAFYPARHDYGDKVLLGHTIRGRGFAEVEEAVDLLVHQPACARLIARQLAQYFVADEPPPALVAAMAQTFQASDGDIRAVLRTLFASPEFTASLGAKFKDPMHYVVSALRLAYDGAPIPNLDAALGWLNSQGEAPFAHQSPDGYALVETGWASSGQLSRRFEIARAIASGHPDLAAADPPASGLYAQTLRPWLSPTTLAALDQAKSPQERGTFLLASPEFNYR
jgi:uncharacterized protein (DUF1800 family)